VLFLTSPRLRSVTKYLSFRPYQRFNHSIESYFLGLVDRNLQDFLRFLDSRHAFPTFSEDITLAHVWPQSEIAILESLAQSTSILSL
jgi:hypothetical protein